MQSKRKILLRAGLALLLLLVIEGCGAAPAETPTPTAQFTATTPTPTGAAEATPTAQVGQPTPGSGGTVDIQVASFTVARNFEIRGQFTATNNGKTAVQEVAPNRIALSRQGEPVFEGSAQGGVMDDKAMAGLPPGVSRPYGFSTAPGRILAQVEVGDEVSGTLTVLVDGQEQQVSLPTTNVTVQRIP